MQRQRGELVPIGKVVADLDGPVKAIREASPQALRHFTRFDQVNQLVAASEADPDLGFMARMMALCSLPRSNPGNRKEYKRVNGPLTLIMLSSSKTKLPYGNLPRLILAWVCTEAVRTRSRDLVLGVCPSNNLAQFRQGGRFGRRGQRRTGAEGSSTAGRHKQTARAAQNGFQSPPCASPAPPSRFFSITLRHTARASSKYCASSTPRPTRPALSSTPATKIDESRGLV